MAESATSTGGVNRGVTFKDFTGGLNNVSDISSIADNELADIVNLEIDSTGSLVARPPVTRFSNLPGGMPTVAQYKNVVTNTHATTSTSTKVIRSNLVRNPRGATGPDAWSAVGTGGTSTLTLMTTGGQGGEPWYMRATITAVPTGSPFNINVTKTGINGMPVTPGGTYTASAYTRASVMPSNGLRVDITWYDAAGTWISATGGDSSQLGSNVWARLSNTAVAPAGAAFAHMAVAASGPSGAWTVGTTFDASAPLFESSFNVLDYFSGVRANTTDYTYLWSGTADQSISYVRVDDCDSFAGYNSASIYRSKTQGIAQGCLAVDTVGGHPTHRRGMYYVFTESIAINRRVTTYLRVKAPSGLTIRFAGRTSTGEGFGFFDYNGSGDWEEVNFAYITPAAATYFGFQATIINDDGAPPGTVFYLSNMLCVQSGGPYTLGYFSGGTTNVVDPLGGYLVQYVWDSTPEASVSYRRVPNPSAQTPITFLGWYNRADGISFMVVNHGSRTWLFNPNDKSFTATSPSGAASDSVQYQNRLYLVFKTVAGGWYGEVTAGSGVYTYQALSSGTKPMPKGELITVYKDRLWIAGTGSSDERTKVYLSEVTNTAGGDINNFPPLNFIYVGRGDGQWITNLHAGPNDLTIFRNASSYYFRYDSDPALGSLNRYEGNIGCDNKYTKATYQNYLYVLSNGALYQLIGYQFYRRNDPSKMEFRPATATATPTVPASISILGSRLVIWYSGSIYSYQLTSNVWSRWESDTQIGPFATIQRPEGYFGQDMAFGVSGSGDPSSFGLYRIVDDFTSTDKEVMSCRIKTKAYDYQTPDRFKGLFWWTADVLMASKATGTAVPLSLTESVITWRDMDLIPGGWATLDLGTWDHPTLKTPGIITSREMPTPSPERVSLKFLKKLRFRRIYYEVAIETDGSLATGPVHIYSIVTYVETKQKITKAVT